MHLSPVDTAFNMQLTPMEADLHTYGFPSGYFIIKNVASNKVLDVQGDMVEDGAPVILYRETETSLVEGEPESTNTLSLYSLLERYEKARFKQSGISSQQTKVVYCSNMYGIHRCSSLTPLAPCVQGRPDMPST